MLGTLAIWALAFIFLAYAIPHLVVAWFYKTKNLKKAYNADWALVTGASSGEAGSGLGRRAQPAATAAAAAAAAAAANRLPCLFVCFANTVPFPPATRPPPGIGKSIARKLAGQGLNVVLVALGDDLLDATAKELGEQYPRVTFRKASWLAVVPVGSEGSCGCHHQPTAHSCWGSSHECPFRKARMPAC